MPRRLRPVDPDSTRELAAAHLTRAVWTTMDDSTPRSPVTLCVLLWAVDGEQGALVEYEDQVLDLLPSHGGRVVHRVRQDGDPSQPFEVHLLEFPSEAALDAYLGDTRRTALATLRDRAIARTEVLRVEVV